MLLAAVANPCSLNDCNQTIIFVAAGATYIILNSVPVLLYIVEGEL